MEHYKINDRLTELQAEYKKGVELIQQQEAQLAQLRANVIRIEGAIQVLQELMAEAEADGGS